MIRQVTREGLMRSNTAAKQPCKYRLRRSADPYCNTAEYEHPGERPVLVEDTSDRRPGYHTGGKQTFVNSHAC